MRADDSSIAWAVSSANSGDEIVLAPCVYPDLHHLRGYGYPKHVTLRENSPADPILKPVCCQPLFQFIDHPDVTWRT